MLLCTGWQPPHHFYIAEQSREYTVYQMIGGLRSAMGYCGTRTIAELKAKGKFIRMSAAGLRESHPHDVFITKEAPNYHH